MPVPAALHSSATLNLPTVKKNQPHPQHQYQHRRVAAHLKGSRSRLPGPLSVSAAATDLPPVGSFMVARRVAGENIPFDDEDYGILEYSSRAGRHFTQSVNSRTLSLPLRGLNQQNQQLPRRRNLSSWPPSPHGLPPTPTFDDDDDDDVVFAHDYDSCLPKEEYGSADVMPMTERYRENIASWPPVPSNLPPFPLARIDAAFGGLPPSPADVSISVPTSAREKGHPTVGVVHRPSAPNDETSPKDESTLKLIPSPSELLKAANEQARANAAVNLSDWISDAIWEICANLTAHDSVGSPAAGSLRRSPSFSGAIVPPPFKRFVQQTIYQVSASAASLTLGLWFIQRLPIGKVNGELMNDMERAFRDDLLATKTEIPWRLLVLGLTLSNKWLEDNTFTTKTWHEVTGLSIASMRSIESKALALFEWNLGPQPDQWIAWLQQLRRRELATLKAIGSEREGRLISGSTKRPIQDIDQLISEVSNAKPSHEAVSPSISDNSESALSDEYDIDIAEFPRPPTIDAPTSPVQGHWHSRASSWPEPRSMDRGSGLVPRPHSAQDEIYYPRRLKTPAVWDPSAASLDSPQLPTKPRPVYEAVQRPAIAPRHVPMLRRYEEEYMNEDVGYVYEAPAYSAMHLEDPRYVEPMFDVGVHGGANLFDYRPAAHSQNQNVVQGSVGYPYGHGAAVPFIHQDVDRPSYGEVDSRLTRSIVDGHVGNSWTTLAGMLRSF